MEDNGLNDASSKNVYSAHHPTGTPQGCLEWIALALEEGSAYSRGHLADIVLRFSRIFFDANASPLGRAKYMKKFMLKYHAKQDWVDRLERDSSLLTVLHAPSASASGSGGGSAPRVKFRSSMPKSRGRKFCFGYCDPSKVCRPPSNGRRSFRHVCASCGAAHVASACPSWDQSKADAAMRACGM